MPGLFEDIVPLVDRMRSHREKCDARHQRTEERPVIGVCKYVSGKCFLIETIDTTGDHTTELLDLMKLQFEQTEK